MAASSTAVTVLAPNGRRQTVKVSSSTPLLQVLEDVCKKHGFNADEYELKFQRSIVDLSLQWRFASLPNNAKLEMVPSTRQRGGARESAVRIALQLEDGSRLQDSFTCSQTLWELVNHFPQTRISEPTATESTPLCVYMRDEIAGVDALKNTTLKSLGLTGGSAIVRYVLKKFKSPEDGEPMETATGVTAAAIAAAEVEIKEEVPRRREPDPSPKDNGTAINEALDQCVGKPAAEAASVSLSSDTESQQVVRPKNRPVQVQDEAEEQPGPSGERSMHVKEEVASNSATSTVSTFVPFSGGGQRLGSAVGEGSEIWREAALTTNSSQTSPSGTGSPPKAKKSKPSHDHKHPETTRAKQQDGEEDEAEFLEPVDREPLVYHMDTGPRRTSLEEDLPDEFFEVTVDDIRKRFAQLKSERKYLEEAPLMTKAMRDTQIKEKMERYPKVVVRIQFPDRHVLQGFFRPLETVGALKQFVRSHLADPQTSFYLFIAPPKTNLDDPDATLFQANLFPAALVYFGSDVKTGCYLQRQLLESSVSALQADEAITSCMPRSPAPASAAALSEEPFPFPAAQSEPTGLRGAGDEQPEPDSEAPKPVRTDSGKVPKWLKLPGKK
ncbi:tether containing UBX domain for GLUT4 [Scleropages formosus]|uniref:ASPSCR1 tether for SLC2A4, UBX domain containing n=1 Tax=Scleropages formosus TaxID=113540 RepID=A0A8C9S9T0_SCLFO|nr:tether containing UBX domain for GLUT4 [Scleropages formosus]